MTGSVPDTIFPELPGFTAPSKLTATLNDTSHVLLNTTAEALMAGRASAIVSGLDF